LFHLTAQGTSNTGKFITFVELVGQIMWKKQTSVQIYLKCMN